jgi:hypothetical protein
MSKITRELLACSAILMVASTSGCMMPVGYTYVKDANAMANNLVTVIKVEPTKIYDATAVSLVGPLAGANATGVKYTIADSSGKTHQVLQPATDKYQLRVGDKASYIVVRGQVWIQPVDYPLPPEFGIANTTSIPQPLASTNNDIQTAASNMALHKPTYKPNLTEGWVDQGLSDNVKAVGATLYALNGKVNGGLLYFPNNRTDISDFKMYAEGRHAIQASALKNPVRGEIRYFDMNGHRAAGFEVTGDTNGMRFTYFRTIVEFGTEVRDLNMWALVSNFQAAKPGFEEFARQLGR